MTIAVDNEAVLVLDVMEGKLDNVCAWTERGKVKLSVCDMAVRE